jgi:hypothetical protein
MKDLWFLVLFAIYLLLSFGIIGRFDKMTKGGES